MTSGRLTGRVDRYDPGRGYGVIRGADHQEYFVHYRDLQHCTTLQPEQTVSFVPQPGRKGNLAKAVRIL